MVISRVRTRFSLVIGRPGSLVAHPGLTRSPGAYPPTRTALHMSVTEELALNHDNTPFNDFMRWDLDVVQGCSGRGKEALIGSEAPLHVGSLG